MDSFSGTATDTCSPGKTYAIYLELYFLNYKIITNFAVGIMTNINKYYILKIKANEKVILYLQRRRQSRRRNLPRKCWFCITQ